MEKEQIIKALECCTRPECGDCPYDGDELLRPCHHNMMLDALALIKELTEENKRLTSEVSVKKKLLKRCSDLVETIQAYTVQRVYDKFSIHFGTYTKETKVKVVEVFKLLSEIEEEILNKTEDENK